MDLRPHSQREMAQRYTSSRDWRTSLGCPKKVLTSVEVEQAHQIPDGRAVDRNIRIV
jgi:hypothetical protein